MPIELHHETGDTYRLDVRGRLGMAEYARCEAEMAATLQRSRAPVEFFPQHDLERARAWLSSDTASPAVSH